MSESKYACVMFKCSADAEALKEMLTKFGFNPCKITLEEPDYVHAMSIVMNDMHSALVRAVTNRENKVEDLK